METAEREALERTCAICTHTLHLLAEAKLPEEGARRDLQTLVREVVEAWERSFWARWRQPEASILPALCLNAFEQDLALERERAEWRRLARIEEAPFRGVRAEWRERIAGLASLGEEEKQRLAARLRGRGMLEAAMGPGGSDPGSLEVLLQAVELPEGLNGRFREGFAEAFASAMENGASNTVAQLGLGQEWLLADPRAMESLREYAGWYGDKITKLLPTAWQEDLKQEIIAGLDGGESAQEMTARLKGRFEGLKTWEAERIARTESVRARVEGRFGVYRMTLVRRVVWLTADSPCPICDPRNGKEYDLETAPAIPAHPHCRCDYAAAAEDLDRMRREALAGLGPIEPWPIDLPGRYGEEPSRSLRDVPRDQLALRATEPRVLHTVPKKPKTTQEAARFLNDVLTRRTGAVSGFSGNVRTMEEGRVAQGEFGCKEWNCEISLAQPVKAAIDSLLTTSAAEWAEIPRVAKVQAAFSVKILAHELVHSMGVSGEIGQEAFRRIPGLHEAVTEVVAWKEWRSLFRELTGFAPTGVRAEDIRPAYFDWIGQLGLALGVPIDGKTYHQVVRAIPRKAVFELAFEVEFGQATIDKLASYGNMGLL